LVASTGCRFRHEDDGDEGGAGGRHVRSRRRTTRIATEEKEKAMASLEHRQLQSE
jgi:hypothetical protein